MLTALRRSHDGERKLVKKLRETNQEIVQNAARVQQALKLSEEDAATIEELKKQIERAWNMVEQANGREEQATTTIERLQAEIGQLSSIVQKHANLLGGDMTIEELISTRDMLAIQLREAKEGLAYEKERASQMSVDLESRNEKLKERKSQVKNLERAVAQKAAEELKEFKKRTAAEAEIKSLKETIGVQKTDAVKTVALQKEAEAAKDRMAHQLEQSRMNANQLTMELQNLQNEKVKQNGDIEQLQDRIAQLTELRAKLDHEVKSTKTDLHRERTASNKLQSKLDMVEKEMAELRKELGRTEDEAAGLKSDKNATEKELTKEMLRTKDAQSAGERLAREKAAAEKKAAQEQSKVAQAKDLAQTLKTGTVSLENEVRRLTIHAQERDSKISLMEREKVRHLQVIEGLEKRIQELEEEAELKEVQINELDKREIELQGKIKASSQLYETMRAERNAISKQLSEAAGEIHEAKRKSKVQGNQIEQLKEEIHSKDKGLVAEQFESASLGKKLEMRNHEVDQLRRLLEDASESVRKSENEIVELNKGLQRMDADALAQKRAYDQVVAERDINQSQLMRRNDEIALLYERVAVMTTMMSTGEHAYRQRMDDIKLLKLKLADVKRELNIATDETAAGNKEAMKQENVRLQRELLNEQSRVKGLSEELSNPLNVHRWRKLEGSDPTSFDLIVKAQTLQRRLIAKTEAVVEREMQLSEKDREIADLRMQLNNVPGPEVVEQLATVRIALNERTRELKAVASEVNMAQAQVEEYKFEADKLSKELLEMKSKMYEMTRRHNETSSHSVLSGAEFEATLKQKQKALQAASRKPVFTGGGFNVHSA